LRRIRCLAARNLLLTRDGQQKVIASTTGSAGFPRSVTSYALAFTVTDALIAGSWLAIVAWLSDRARALLRRPRVRSALDRAAATALVALGLKVATEQLA
jgi:threonine/homoserine/homoserine lactone efflux protein